MCGRGQCSGETTKVDTSDSEKDWKAAQSAMNGEIDSSIGWKHTGATSSKAPTLKKA